MKMSMLKNSGENKKLNIDFNISYNINLVVEMNK